MLQFEPTLAQDYEKTSGKWLKANKFWDNHCGYHTVRLEGIFKTEESKWADSTNSAKRKTRPLRVCYASAQDSKTEGGYGEENSLAVVAFEDTVQLRDFAQG